MYVDRSVKVGYLAHPRTASKACAWALTHRLEFVRIGAHHSGGELEKGWTYFTATRNPFDALCSWRRYLDREVEMTPEWWERWFRTEGASYVDTDGDDWRLWFHLRAGVERLEFSEIERAFRGMLERCGLEPVALPSWQKRKVEVAPYREQIGPALRAWVEDRFGAEMERLSYSW